MLIKALGVILVGFFSGVAFLAFLKKISLKLKLLTPKGVPLVGGVGFAGAFILATVCGIGIFGAIPKETYGILLASILMLIFGLLDDWWELSVLAKFIVQIIATLILIFFGVRTHIVYIGDLANIMITLIWVLAITNAFNHLDVMDGVTAISALVISLAFLAFSLVNNDPRAFILSLALIGSIASFLIYNFPPARLYMGNAGSHFLGFLLAALAMGMAHSPLERKVALLSPILILGFPIFDTVFLVLVRLGKKKIPFQKSNDHLVLRFLASGYTKRKTLWVVTYWSAFFVLCGIAVSRATNFWGMLIIIGVIFASLVFAKKMSRVVIND